MTYSSVARNTCELFKAGGVGKEALVDEGVLGELLSGLRGG